MAEMLATRDMVVLGKKVRAGEPVPMDKLAPERQRQLIQQKRVETHSVRVRKED